MNSRVFLKGTWLHRHDWPPERCEMSFTGTDDNGVRYEVKIANLPIDRGCDIWVRQFEHRWLPMTIEFPEPEPNEHSQL